MRDASFGNYWVSRLRGSYPLSPTPYQIFSDGNAYPEIYLQPGDGRGEPVSGPRVEDTRFIRQLAGEEPSRRLSTRRALTKAMGLLSQWRSNPGSPGRVRRPAPAPPRDKRETFNGAISPEPS